MDYPKTISYIFNVEEAELFSEGEVSAYDADVKCSSLMEPNQKDLVRQICEKHDELNFVDADLGAKKKRFPMLKFFAVLSVGVLAGCWFTLKYDKEGETIGHMAKRITVAAKAITVTANAASSMINRSKS